MIRHRERFDECGLVQGDVADRVHPPCVDNDFLTQAATAARQTNEAQLGAQVVVTAETGTAFITDDVGLNDDTVSDGQAGDAFPEFLDGAGELVSQGDRSGLVGKPVGLAWRRGENGSFEEFVEIGAADPAPGHGDLHRSRTHLRLLNVFDPEIFAGVESCCFHGVHLRIPGRGRARSDASTE